MRAPLPVPTISRRARIIIGVVVAVVLLFVLLGTFVSVYVDWLWYGESGYRSVYTTALRTRVLLFLMFGLLMAAAVGGNLALAYRFRPPFRPLSAEQQNLERYRSAIEPRRKLLLGIVCVLVGVFTGATAQGNWQVWQLWRNGQQFGITDPQFDRDISYFAFTYPFQRFVLGMLFAAVLISLLGAVVMHYLFGGLRLQTPGERVTPAARAHLSVLLGAFVLLKAVAYYLDRYGLVFSERSAANVTGASYTDINALLPAKTILMIIALLCAVAFIANVWFRNFQLPAIALVLLILSSVLIGGAYPALIQQFRVKPNADQREEPYIARNIEATRAAYGLDDVEYIDFNAETEPSPETIEAIRNDTATIPNARLLDPNVVAPTFDQLQRIRNFFSFPPTLDIDRYTIDGELEEYVVAARELDPAALTDNQTNWINRHTVFTHGNGFVSAPANQVNSNGEPVFNVQDLPTTGNIPIDQPRIYYGELIGDTYSIVGGTEEPREFDLPGESGDDVKFTYDGAGGVDIGGFVNRLAFAWHYTERNILFNDAISNGSKILYVRDPRERVEKAAPFLKADGDPYPAVIDGRIVWIVDAYTTMNGYPYSEHITLGELTEDSLTGEGQRGQPQEEINYIRNSVKATVDAYDGTVTLYEFGERDPVLETWKKVFPGIIKPQSEISDELQAHLRYPEDLFKVQRTLLARYHVDDPIQFFNSQNFWEVPPDPNPTQSGEEAQPPYYILAQGPGQTEPTFQLTTALNALERPNLAAYMTASSDPEDYGTLRVAVLPTSTTQPGPVQMQSQFNSDPEVATEVSLLDQQGSNVIYGNLLTLPVGESLLYVQPLYVQGQGTNYPLLRRVIVGFGDDVAYERTLSDALDEIFGEGAGDRAPDTGRPEAPEQPPPTEEGPPPAEGDVSPEVAAALTKIDQALDDIDAAMREGDLAAFGEAQAALQAAIEEYNAASGRGGGDAPDGGGGEGENPDGGGGESSPPPTE